MQIKPTPCHLKQDLQLLAKSPKLKKDEVFCIVTKFYQQFQIKSSINYRSKFPSSYDSYSRPIEIQTLSFDALESNCQKIPEMFKAMAQFVIDYENTNNSFVLSEKSNLCAFYRKDIAYIMCLMGLNLTNPSHYQYKIVDIKVYNFSHIFSKQCQKAASIVKYFQLLFDKKLKIESKLQIKRQSKKFFSMDSQQFKLKYMQHGIELDPDFPQKKSIDEYQYPKIDFANKYIGGGALSKGFFQEQSLFHTHPELYTTIVLCKPIENDEALRFVGFNKITNMSKEQTIIAIDAQNYTFDPKQQFQPHNIERQIMKAYIGFSSETKSRNVVTGNWGCGYYHGNLQLKYMIQWIAACLAEKRLIYCSYEIPYTKFMLPKDLFNKIKSMEVQRVYRMLLWAAEKLKKYNGEDIYGFMEDFNDKAKLQARRASINKRQVHNDFSQKMPYDISYNHKSKKYNQNTEFFPQKQVKTAKISIQQASCNNIRSNTIAKTKNVSHHNTNFRLPTNNRKMPFQERQKDRPYELRQNYKCNNQALIFQKSLIQPDKFSRN